MSRRFLGFILVSIVAAACGRELAFDKQASPPPVEPAGGLSKTLSSSGGSPDDVKAMMGLEASIVSGSASGETVGSVAPGRQIIRASQIEIVVEDSEAAGAGVQDLARSLGGFVDGMSAERRGDQMDYHLTIRVPSERLGEALTAVRKLGLRVESEKQASTDVTDDVVDLDARLRTLKATESELLALLSESRQRGRKVDDIMAVYRELTGIRTEIEQTQGRLNSMDRQVAYSSIDVVLRPNPATLPAVPDGWRPAETVRDAARALVTVAKGLGNGAIYAAILGLPLLLLLSVPTLVGVRVWRRVRRRA
jgi:hypothetical protein